MLLRDKNIKLVIIMNNIEIVDYIDYISKRPAMYLIKCNYDGLMDCISYFTSFKEIFDLMTEKDTLFVNKFPEWICKKYNYSIEKKRSWEKIIEVENPNNPMEIFFKELEAFKKEFFFS